MILDYSCKACGGFVEEIMLPEDNMHHGEYRCVECYRHNGWIPKPKNKDKRRDNNKNWRKKWLEKGFTCAICGATQQEYRESSQWNVDHILPLESGGEDVFENTMMLCTFCHTYKTVEQKRLKAMKRRG